MAEEPDLDEVYRECLELVKLKDLAAQGSYSHRMLTYYRQERDRPVPPQAARDLIRFLYERAATLSAAAARLALALEREEAL